jgi:hypothetical protein
MWIRLYETRDDFGRFRWVMACSEACAWILAHWEDVELTGNSKPTDQREECDYCGETG